MKRLASALAFYAGQTVAQELPFDELIMVEAALCTTKETAIEVASTMANKGFSAGVELFNTKENCAFVRIPLRLLKIDTFFKTPEGTIKVIEAVINEQGVYVITLSDIQGITEI